jgi:Lon protease-like protein
MADQDDTHELPGTAPVFPLPDTVFFPRTVLPLHIFEPRYREMIARTLEGNGYIAMALRRSGDGETGYYPVGCLGRIAKSRKTDDGRYYLQLVGLRKVSFGEVVGAEPFVTARIAPIDEMIPADTAPGSHDDLVKLLGACTILFQEVSEKQFPMVSIKEGLPYEAVVNSICFHLGLPTDVKQSLLEEDDLRNRCHQLTELVNRYLHKIVFSRDDEAGSNDEGLVN